MSINCQPIVNQLSINCQRISIQAYLNLAYESYKSLRQIYRTFIGFPKDNNQYQNIFSKNNLEIMSIMSLFFLYTNVAFPSVPSPGTKSSTWPWSVMSSMKAALPASSPVTPAENVYGHIINYFHKKML